MPDHICVSVYMCSSAHTCVCRWRLKAGIVSSLVIYSLSYKLSQDLSQSPELRALLVWANQCALRICLLSAGITNSQPHHPDLMFVLGIQTLVFMVGHQVFFLLKYLPSLKRLAFSVMASCSSESCNGWRLISIPF